MSKKLVSPSGERIIVFVKHHHNSNSFFGETLYGVQEGLLGSG